MCIRDRNDRDRRDFVTCGAAAGVAAAFRAPVGGHLFALEELSSHWSKSLLIMVFFTTAVVNVTTRMVMSVCTSGHCGFFGEGNLIIFHISEGLAQVRARPWQIALLVGVQRCMHEPGTPTRSHVVVTRHACRAPHCCRLSLHVLFAFRTRSMS